MGWFLVAIFCQMSGNVPINCENTKPLEVHVLKKSCMEIAESMNREQFAPNGQRRFVYCQERKVTQWKENH